MKHKLPKQFVKALPKILTVLAVGGMVGTTAATIHATVKTVKKLEEEKDIKISAVSGTGISKMEILKAAAPEFILPAGLAVGTITCILGAEVLNVKQQAAIIGAYETLASSYRNYRHEVIERHGVKEDQAIKRAIRNIKEYDTDRYDYAYAGLPSTNEPLIIYNPYGVNEQDKWFKATPLDLITALNEGERHLAREGFVSFGEILDNAGFTEHSDDLYQLMFEVNDDMFDMYGYPVLNYWFYEKTSKDPDAPTYYEMYLEMEPSGIDETSEYFIP